MNDFDTQLTTQEMITLERLLFNVMAGLPVDTYAKNKEVDSAWIKLKQKLRNLNQAQLQNLQPVLPVGKLLGEKAFRPNEVVQHIEDQAKVYVIKEVDSTTVTTSNNLKIPHSELMYVSDREFWSDYQKECYAELENSDVDYLEGSMRKVDNPSVEYHGDICRVINCIPDTPYANVQFSWGKLIVHRANLIRTNAGDKTKALDMEKENIK